MRLNLNGAVIENIKHGGKYVVIEGVRPGRIGLFQLLYASHGPLERENNHQGYHIELSEVEFLDMLFGDGPGSGNYWRLVSKWKPRSEDGFPKYWD